MFWFHTLPQAITLVCLLALLGLVIFFTVKQLIQTTYIAESIVSFIKKIGRN